ncbi:MAG: response regulator [bacterium]
MKTLDILIMDDEIKICEMLKQVLSNMGHRVYITTSGEDALYMMGLRKFDIAFLDIQMTDIGGDQILMDLKNLDNPAKVIIYSALSDERMIAYFSNLGADAYLTKPCKIDQIEKTIENLINPITATKK